MQTEKISANGISLNVATAGDGPPVLLLHGFPNSHKLWSKVAPGLVEAGFKVIAYDQRGFGDSDAPPTVSSYKLNEIISDAVALLRALQVKEKVHVVGHDWGAIIAWLLAIRHPELVETLTAISVGHPMAYRFAGLEQKLKGWYIGLFLMPGIAEAVFKLNDWKALRRMAGKTGTQPAQEPVQDQIQEWIDEISRPGRLTAGFNWYRANILQLFFAQTPDCLVPTLGIYGPDPALAEEQMVTSEKYVDAKWRYERFHQCGHWIPLDKPEQLTALLINWFNS